MGVAHQLSRALHSREPGTFFGAGIVAGLVLFLAWYALLPSTGAPIKPTDADTITAARAVALGSNGSVLSPITGETLSAGQASVASVVDETFDDAVGEGQAEMDAMGDDALEAYAQQDAGSADGREMAQGLLEAGSEDGTLPLRAWFVEVLREDERTEVLRIDAESPEHALSIVRDYRGDPRVLRGPSAQPFE